MKEILEMSQAEEAEAFKELNSLALPNYKQEENEKIEPFVSPFLANQKSSQEDKSKTKR